MGNGRPGSFHDVWSFVTKLLASRASLMQPPPTLIYLVSLSLSFLCTAHYLNVESNVILFRNLVSFSPFLFFKTKNQEGGFSKVE